MGACFHFQNACYSLFISSKVDKYYEYKPGPGSSSGIPDGPKTYLSSLTSSYVTLVPKGNMDTTQD